MVINRVLLNRVLLNQKTDVGVEFVRFRCLKSARMLSGTIRFGGRSRLSDGPSHQLGSPRFHPA